MMDNSAPNPKRRKLRHNSITEYFKCHNCHNYLTPPTSFCLEGHILCQLCADNEYVCPQCGKALSTKLNKFIDDITKDLKLPCKNAKNGCSQFYKWDEELEHFNKCHFRTFKCPLFWNVFNGNANCQWEGIMFDMKKHIIHDAHDDLIRNIDDYSTVVYFDVDMSKNNYHAYPISVGDHVFLLQLTKTRKAALKLNFVGIFENTGNYKAKLKINNSDNDFTLIYQLDCKPLSNNDNDNCGKEITNSVLASFIDNNPVLKCSLKIITQKAILKSCDSILREVECSICVEYMLSKIYVCNYGHSICETCKTRVVYCPTCRTKVQSIRNYKLESLISKLQFPCTFRTNGCTDLVTPDKINEHETVCTFGKYKCPISPCFWEGTQNQMLDHAKQTHTSCFTEKQDIITFSGFKNWRKSIQIVNVQQKPFICYYEKNFDENLFCMAVQTYGNNASKYYYTLQIGDREKRYTTTQEICTKYDESMPEVISKEHCILLNLDYVTTFVDDEDKLICYSTIIKRNN